MTQQESEAWGAVVARAYRGVPNKSPAAVPNATLLAFDKEMRKLSVKELLSN